MTAPEYSASDPNAPSPASLGLADRLASIQQQHPWMDPAASVTLASSATSNRALDDIVSSLHQAVQNTYDGITHFFDDPVLQQKPTFTLAMQRYLSGAVGPMPVVDSDLLHIQSELQKRGYGKDLPANGLWNTGWQAAFQQHASAEYQNQLSGNRPGSKSAGGFLHSLLSSLNPSGVADAVVGFVKSIPGDLQDAGGVLWSGLKALPSEIAHPNQTINGNPHDQFHQQLKQQVSRDYGQANRALGGSASDTQILSETEGQAWLHAVNAVGTVFLLSGVGGAAKGIGQAAVKERAAGLLTRDVTTAEAMRGQGVIAKTLLKPMVTRAATGAVVGGGVGGAQAELRGGNVAQGIGTGLLLGAVTGAAMPQRAFENLPILKNTGPTLGKLLDDDGLYYTARTRLATPYQYGAVRLAGTAMGQAQAFSLKAHGVGYLEQLVGGPQAGVIQNAIQNANVLDPVNAALRNRLSFTAAGLHFTPDLDYLMYFLHGPMTTGAEGTASKAIGDTVRASTDGFNAALQHVGAIGQVEQGTGMSYGQLLKLAGGDPDRLHMWIGNKVKQHAAMQHAEEVVGLMREKNLAPDLFSDDHYNLLRSEAAQVWNDPDAMRTAVARMLESGQNYLARNIQNELTRAAVNPTAHLRHELSDYLDAGDLLTHQVLPHADRYLLTPTPITKVVSGVDPSLYPNGLPESLMETVSQMRRSPSIPGSLGLARIHTDEDGAIDTAKSTLTSQQATRDLKKFTEQATAAQTPSQQVAFVNDALHYLFNNYGLDARKLSVFASTPDKILNLLADRAKTLAAEVYPSHDAPPELQRALHQIEAKGYRVVAGTDIGHAFRSDLPPLQDLGQPITTARRVVSTLGMNPQRFSRLDYGADRRLRVTVALQRAVDDGRITLPPFYTVQTLLNDLQDDRIVGKQLPWAANVLFAASRRAHKGAIEDLIRTGAAEDVHAAEARLKANIAAAAGLRQLTVKDVKRVLTRTDNVPWVSGAQDSKGFTDLDNPTPLMSDKHATEVWKALQQGFSETPAYMLGLQKVEDFARYMPFKVRDALAQGTTVKGVKVPAVPGVARLTDNQATLALMSLPTRIAQLRDTYRFNLSPYFSLRRIAKTNLKMAADGVEPTVTPVRSLTDRGVYDDAHQLLDRILGRQDPKYTYLDEADRYLDSQDVFGLYNARHYEAYYAQAKKEQGATDEQIRDGLIRTFMYGANGQEGRTALERSANVIFFPFSFEKTVARNIGGYLLDHPAQTMVLSNALDAYRDFNNHHLDGSNPLAASWWQQHAPLMNEVLRLNAFANGISPGELGGVNRPLMNAFMPQSWATNKTTTATLGRFIPAMADLKRIISEGTDQSRIVRQSVLNGMAAINGEPTSILNPRPSTKTTFQQRLDAQQYRAMLIGAFGQVLAYNDRLSSDDQKYHFGSGPKIPAELQGAVISRTNIGRIVHQAYPVYDPFAGAAFKIQRDNEAKLWLDQRKGTPTYDAYKDFYEKATTAISHLNKDEYDPQQAQQVFTIFHTRAIDLAEKDPAFYKWYRQTFANSLGPLERIQ